MGRWIAIGVLGVVCIVLLSLGTGAIGDVNDLQAELNSTQDEYAELNANYEELNANYEELSATYPPRDFWSVEELVEWLAEDTTDQLFQIGGYRMGDAAARLQHNAMEDGYLLSLYPVKVREGTFEYSLMNCAIITGSAYLVNPATDEVSQIGHSGIYGDYF